MLLELAKLSFLASDPVDREYFYSLMSDNIDKLAFNQDEQVAALADEL